ncbi:hypothetical protein [Arthrobacter sp. Br18]|uniref:hypothetical protein n=1 Tax=Arthrobacter sp. Br18 TaxID=1312954 RepID=UPI00047EB09A|nr:hypothetical protein [Arthrobacter sp. Br18]
MGARRKSWKDLGPGQRFGLLLGAAVQWALLALALGDLRRRPAEQIRGSKRWWSAAVFVNTIGPVSYFLWGGRRP